MFSQFLTDTMCVSRGKMQTIKREQVQKYQRIYDNIPCYLYFAKNNLGYLAGSDVAKLTPGVNTIIYTKVEYCIERGDIVTLYGEDYTVNAMRRKKMLSGPESLQLTTTRTSQ